MLPHLPGGQAPEVQDGVLSGEAAVGVAVDEQVVVEAVERVVQDRAVGADLDAVEPGHVGEIAAHHLHTAFQPAGRALVDGSLDDGR